MRTKACLGWWFWIRFEGKGSERHEGIYGTKSERRSFCRRGTAAEWSNIFAFWLPLWKCKSKDRKRVWEETKWRDVFKCSECSSRKSFVSEKRGQAAIVDGVLVRKNVLEMTNPFQHGSALESSKISHETTAATEVCDYVFERLPFCSGGGAVPLIRERFLFFSFQAFLARLNHKRQYFDSLLFPINS